MHLSPCQAGQLPSGTSCARPPFLALHPVRSLLTLHPRGPPSCTQRAPGPGRRGWGSCHCASARQRCAHSRQPAPVRLSHTPDGPPAGWAHSRLDPLTARAHAPGDLPLRRPAAGVLSALSPALPARTHASSASPGQEMRRPQPPPARSARLLGAPGHFHPHLCWAHEGHDRSAQRTGLMRTTATGSARGHSRGRVPVCFPPVSLHCGGVASAPRAQPGDRARCAVTRTERFLAAAYWQGPRHVERSTAATAVFLTHGRMDRQPSVRLARGGAAWQPPAQARRPAAPRGGAGRRKQALRGARR